MYAFYTVALNKLVVIKYTSTAGERLRLHIIQRASHKWKDIACLICNNDARANSLELKYNSDACECLREVFREDFIMNRPAADRYSQDWKGLIELLRDVNLGTLAEDVEYALAHQTI